MKIIAIITLFLFNLTAICQDWDETCDQAIQRASNDFAKGEMRAISYGLPVFDESYDFQLFYDDYLKEHYNVLSYNGGCVLTESSDCYANRMFELIEDKFGEDFFPKTRKELKKTINLRGKEVFNDLQTPTTHRNQEHI